MTKESVRNQDEYRREPPKDEKANLELGFVHLSTCGKHQLEVKALTEDPRVSAHGEVHHDHMENSAPNLVGERRLVYNLSFPSNRGFARHGFKCCPSNIFGERL